MPTPTLVIMAAGMGSRFGGLKQLTPVDDGHAIIDYSLYDAWRAGFRRVVFIIKQAIMEEFRAGVGRRAEEHFDVTYVCQELDMLPEGFTVPEGRSKPWGTAHAVACCRDVLTGPFAVINADDFYGAEAYRSMYDYLAAQTDPTAHAMLGYRLRSTLTENGSVSRGICQVENGQLLTVTERTRIVRRGDAAAYTEDGETYVPLTGDEAASMNFWGFGPAFLPALWQSFARFLQEKMPLSPQKCEFYLPYVVNEILTSGQGSVRVLPCDERWYGMTYREDMPAVRAAIAEMTAAGRYPKGLWAPCGE